MKRRVLVGLGLTAALAFGACTQDASKTDLDEPKQSGRAIPQDYKATAPDAITVFQNVDGHPSIVRVCIDGLAFRTLSTSHNGGFEGAAARVEEWDDYCATVRQ